MPNSIKSFQKRHPVPAEPGSLSVALGIETSCDETAAAVVACNERGQGRILANIVRSQWSEHLPYGGVVPEIAARAHVECLDELIIIALRESNVGFDDLSCVAATAGPGLIGGLIVGLMSGKAIALSRDIPFIAVNHLEAHALTVGLSHGVAPPYLLLLVSGGHTQLLIVHDVDRYTRIGTTIDDALGEAFDKTAKLLSLPQPGGPAVERRALEGDPKRFKLPRPMHGRAEPNFSFAGLKTAVRQRALEVAPLSERDVNDLCASFQAAVVDTLADRCARAFAICDELMGGACKTFVVAGGVGANQRIRSALSDLSSEAGYRLVAPPISLCGDNGAMIAWTGIQRLARGLTDGLDAPARPRWPLDKNAPAAIGAGVKA